MRLPGRGNKPQDTALPAAPPVSDHTGWKRLLSNKYFSFAASAILAAGAVMLQFGSTKDLGRMISLTGFYALVVILVLRLSVRSPKPHPGWERNRYILAYRICTSVSVAAFGFSLYLAFKGGPTMASGIMLIAIACMFFGVFGRATMICMYGDTASNGNGNGTSYPITQSFGPVGVDDTQPFVGAPGNGNPTVSDQPTVRRGRPRPTGRTTTRTDFR